jgi:hypothetical protein
MLPVRTMLRNPALSVLLSAGIAAYLLAQVCYKPLRQNETIFTVTLITLPYWAVVVYLFARWYKKRLIDDEYFVNVHQKYYAHFRYMLAAFVAWLGAVAMAAGLFYLANGFFDRSAAKLYVTNQISTERSIFTIKETDIPLFYIHTPSFTTSRFSSLGVRLPLDADERAKVSKEDFLLIQDKLAHLQIRYKDGFLDVPWMVDSAAVPVPPLLPQQ